MRIANVQYGLKGAIQVSVVEGEKVVREYPVQSNLILNSGLDKIASTAIADCFAYGVAGTGVTPTESDSQSDTLTIVSGTVTVGIIGYLAGDATDVGRTIKLDTSGNTYLITAFISTTQCSVTPSSSIGPDTFVIYNTNQTGLTAEVKRTSTYLTAAPNCQTVTVGNVTTMTRTFDFSMETGGIAYNEVGFSNVVSAGSNLFSRIKLPSAVPLISGQQLRVKYSVSVTVTPFTPLAYVASPVVGWPTATGTLQCIGIPLAIVGTTGVTSMLQAQNPVDLYYYAAAGELSLSSLGSGDYPAVGISTDASAHASYGANQSVGGTSFTQAVQFSSYVAGTYTRDKYTILAVGDANRVDWRTVTMSGRYGGAVAFRFLMDMVQTKLSTYTLTLGFRYIWNRVL